MTERERTSYYKGRSHVPKPRPPNAREVRLKAERLERLELESAIHEHWTGYLIAKLKLRALSTSDDDLKAAYAKVIANLEDGL